MKKGKILITIFILTLVGIFGYWQYNEYQLRNLTAGVLTIKEIPIVVEIANTPATRIRGLGGRESLNENEGMLFAFATSGKYEFWMKDVVFPIDIIWFDQNFKVIDIEENISPLTYPETFTSKDKARYALEVNSGFSRRNEIKIGENASFEKH